MSSDGGISFDEGAGVLLVRCGAVSADLVSRLAADLSQFIHQVLPSDLSRPMVSVSSMPDPPIVDEQSSEWEAAFQSLLSDIPQTSITILVTGQGLWDPSPSPRFIFAHRYTDGRALLSIRRFVSPDRAVMHARLGKEVIKVLGMALGAGPCPDSRCIMSYHWAVDDLDWNTGVCPECREFVVAALEELLKPTDRSA